MDDQPDTGFLIKGKWNVQKNITKKQVADFPVNPGQSFVYCRMRE